MNLMQLGHPLIPSLKHMRDVEHFVQSRYPVGILLDVHLARLGSVLKLAEAHHKRLILHVDLIAGLQSDEAGVEYVCQTFRPLGIISTRNKAIITARRKNVLAIQRVFLIDSNALANSYKMMEQSNPDYIELMPGILPDLIREVKEAAGKPILTGGFLRTKEDVQRALAAGASAVTTSNRYLWEQFAPPE